MTRELRFGIMRMDWKKVSFDALATAMSTCASDAVSRKTQSKASLIQEAEALLNGERTIAHAFLARLNVLVTEDRDHKRATFRPKM